MIDSRFFRLHAMCLTCGFAPTPEQAAQHLHGNIQKFSADHKAAISDGLCNGPDISISDGDDALHVPYGVFLLWHGVFGLLQEHLLRNGGHTVTLCAAVKEDSPDV